MCHSCHSYCKGSGCTTSLIAKILVIVGGVNWGLVGAGMLLEADWNLVHMLLLGLPTLEAVVYLLVGVAAVYKIFGCHCGKCMSCEDCVPKEEKMG